MNLSTPLLAPSNLLYRIALKSRALLPRQQCRTFGPSNGRQRIEKLFVINLDRQKDRWIEMTRELDHIFDSSGVKLTNRTVRYPAVDAVRFHHDPVEDDQVDPNYTLREQLFVEPQPHAMPDQLELDRPIQMSRSEIAVARSHIGVWRQIASGTHAYVLVLEDDVWFQRGFYRHLDRAWGEMDFEDRNTQRFDILYMSYKEVKHGAQKAILSSSVFRPVRGLWYMSGYVLSRQGAEKLLSLLPCRGPVDLWLNHQFGSLNVQATRQSIIKQRFDKESTNSYSILPALTKIGVLDSEGESLFQMRPQEGPVFAFGEAGSGLSSLAMALSMLGYRCCSDLQQIPETELEKLLAGRSDRVFDAYVNVGNLWEQIAALKDRYPRPKFIVTTREAGASDSGILSILNAMSGYDVAVLPSVTEDKWKVVCEHLICAPPICRFPELEDLGQRPLLNTKAGTPPVEKRKNPKRDKSPWVVETRQEWRGICSFPATTPSTRMAQHVSFDDRFEFLNTRRWMLRDDTFTGNRALFRPSNVEFHASGGTSLRVRRESLAVREYSAASISSRDRFLFGRFEANLQATDVPGVVTGFFLHRDSPRQEIDIEIVGNRSDRLLVNVFYNPGDEGAKFDYGYRGAPTSIALGFKASEAVHRFAIEWDPCEIRWLVDEHLIHRRVNWDPTPIPHLPMTLHVNTWPSRSKELAGRLADRRLPATASVNSIAVEAALAST